MPWIETECVFERVAGAVVVVVALGPPGHVVGRSPSIVVARRACKHGQGAGTGYESAVGRGLNSGRFRDSAKAQCVHGVAARIVQNELGSAGDDEVGGIGEV